MCYLYLVLRHSCFLFHVSSPVGRLEGWKVGKLEDRSKIPNLTFEHSNFPTFQPQYKYPTMSVTVRCPMINEPTTTYSTSRNNGMGPLPSCVTPAKSSTLRPSMS